MLGKMQDLTGKIFGRLTALEVVYDNNVRKWKCKCECGNEVITTTSQLNAGYKTSCGCIYEDYKGSLVNKRFGNLTVISFEGYGLSCGPQWRCKCDCGNEIVVYSKNLNRGVTTHCGCKSKENISKSMRGEFGISIRNSIISSYKSNAKKKNLDFELSNDEVIRLIESDCYFCGREPSNVTNKKNLYGYYKHNGIDRLDSSIGYININCVPCCQYCNYMKNKYTEQEFLAIVKAIAIHKKLI